ncbi:MAG: VOC family protein [Ruthenibacterium sp.]|jgi:hypothetical protein|nr:VOC family protein [Oscillospiraceae bacterium]
MNKVQPGICSQRPPKKYLKKSLHGRVRGMMIPYDEYERAKKFYVYVFGWDVMRVPQGVFIEDTDERPSLMCATGPSQVSWEASQPGYVWAQLVAREHCEKPQVFMEVSMDVPLEDTITTLTTCGWKVVSHTQIKGDWANFVVVEDPDGNRELLWKCPDSRTWEEPEADYDKE